MSDQSHLLPNGNILRYTFLERVVHWLAGLTYVYLLLTGLGFWSPWLFWLAIALGGGNGTVARELHPWFGVVFVFAMVLMYGLWASQMREADVDRQWWRALAHYIRNEEELVPKIDKFNAGQKSLFWGFFWCGIALLVSGLVMWFPQWIPWNLRYVRYVAVLVHAVSALLTIALFMIHLYMGLAIEGGALHSMLNGDVSQPWARAFHRLWYDRVVGDVQARK